VIIWSHTYYVKRFRNWYCKRRTWQH